MRKQEETEKSAMKVVQNLIPDHENLLYFKFKEKRYHTTAQKSEPSPQKKSVRCQELLHFYDT